MGTHQRPTAASRWRGVWRLLAASVTVAGCSALRIPSGPGMPAGPSFRTATHVLTLVATDEPHAPALQPNQIPVVPQRVGLLLTPLDGSPAAPLVEIARDVPRSSDPEAVRILAVEGDRVWIRAGAGFLYDLRNGQLTPASNPPPEQKVPDLASLVTTGRKISETRWLGVHLPEDVSTGKLKPGSPFMPNLFPLRSLPYEALHESQIPTRERRKLYSGQLDTTGPIPRFLQWDLAGEDELSNAVMLAEPAGGEGGLILYEGRFPDLTLHVRRVDGAGSALWTVDTRITRDPQLLPGGEILALRGAPQVPSGTFPQPILVLLNTRTGEMSSTQLRWGSQ